MLENDGAKKYDLEERTYLFAESVRAFVKRLPRTICNIEDVRQLVKASGSVGANYIEANESLGKKDFRMRLRTSRKESKESRYWLRLIDTGGSTDLEKERHKLIQESTELLRYSPRLFSRANRFWYSASEICYLFVIWLFEIWIFPS